MNIHTITAVLSTIRELRKMKAERNELNPAFFKSAHHAFNYYRAQARMGLIEVPYEELREIDGYVEICRKQIGESVEW